jgi:hypothetical protein
MRLKQAEPSFFHSRNSSNFGIWVLLLTVHVRALPASISKTLGCEKTPN